MVQLADNKIKIPKYFGLYGYTIEVIDSKDLLTKNGFTGLADYRDQKLFLQTSIDDFFVRRRAAIEKTFFHEKIHFILAVSGYKELSEDEGLVDTIALCLHQTDKTAVYDKTFDKIFDDKKK